MKAVLISIQPKFVEKIANGEKTIEVRKTRPNIERPFKCYIYCTKGKPELPVERKINRELEDLCDGYEILYWANGKVIGEFVCDKIYAFPYRTNNCFSHYNTYIMENACLTLNETHAYGNGKTLYGWHITDLKIYDKPKELSEFSRTVYLDYSCKIPQYTKPLKRPPQSWCYVEGL